ncbi:MAG: creatininase family protein [Candidatus Lokiarchaeota archaeon]|nr:creatininase family protein [Candidatus Lokiarchaeota archaeon]
MITARPGQVAAVIDEFPAAYVPIGSIEWHGPHLPLGFDGLKAEALVRRVASRIGKGVLFPTMYWRGYRTMNFPFTIHAPSFSAKAIARQLHDMGFKIILMVTGHYPPAQVRNVRGAAAWLMKKHPDTYAMGIPEQFAVQDLGYLGDHAARDETSIGMALFPKLVDMSALPNGLAYIDRCKRLGIMGHDPASEANVDFGNKIVTAFVDRVVATIEDAWTSKSQAPIWALYKEADRLARQHQNVLRAADFIKAQGMDSNRDLLAFARWFVLSRGRQEKGPRKTRSQ